jgi:hypothetical protein
MAVGAAWAQEASLRIEAKVGESPFRRGPVVATQGTPVRLRVAGGSDLEDVRWFQIVPETARYYKNANHPWEKEPYEWVGFGEIDYDLVEIVPWRGKIEVDLKPQEAFRSASRSPYYHSDLGSFWLHVQAVSGDQRLRSTGLEENGERNLSPAVFRLSIQKDESYLGCLTGFFNVPGLFGSVPWQSYHYIGVDCADVLVAAPRRWKGLGEPKDLNVSMLVQQWHKVAEFPVEGGSPKASILWGSGVQPGDAIAVRYTPGKAFQHIGALSRDANGNGRLDAADEIIHAGPHALHRTHLREGGFDGEVVILRPPP